MIKKSKGKRVIFVISLILIFGIITLLYYLASAFWFTYSFLLISIIALVILRNRSFYKGFKALICWILVITISMVGLSFFRVEKNVSLTGVVARESIRHIMQLPSLSGDGLFEQGADFTSNESKWSPPKGYGLEKYDLEGLPLEMLTRDGGREEKVILHFHGGAYVMGLSDIYRNVALRYSKISGGATVATIDYRLAPENVFPAALEDAQKAWEWLLYQGYDPHDIIIAGDSAGGNLALALTAKLRDEERELPNSLVLMSPWTDMAAEGASYKDNIYKDPIFGLPKGTDIIDKEKGNAYAADTDLYHPYLSPIYGEFDNFPPMLIQVGTYEILESDSQTLYDKAIDADVDAILTKHEGMFHVFQLAGNLIPESRAAWIEVKDYIIKQFE